MGRSSVPALVLSLLALAGSAAFAANAPDPALDTATRTVSEAFANPSNADAFERYYRSLKPDADGFVVVEGDLLMNRDELEAYVSQHAAAAARPTVAGGELLVNRKDDGSDDFYADPAARHLTYAFDTSTFTADQLKTARTALHDAAARWVAVCPACGISFAEVELAEHPFFKVRVYGDGRYLAASFFPSSPAARRILNLDGTFFSTSISRTGILRHELGHVLGYRHEHIQGIAGCFSEGGLWRPLTPYDAKSVMHYFCGGGGSLELELSPSDVRGHRALYGPHDAAALTEPLATLAPDLARVRVATLLDAALRNRNDAAAVNAWKATLPRTSTGLWVVEGDLLMSDDELEVWLAEHDPAAPAPVAPGGELLVNRIGPPYADDVYDSAHRTLRYRVDRASFPDQAQYDEAVQRMEAAAKEWMDVCPECGIHFEHVAQYDTETPPAGALNFEVRLQDEQGEFIAVSFFPHDPQPRRQLILDPSFFTTDFDHTGVLRHELGHVLGYRHEHTRGIAGCYFEDTSWRPLTPYDPKSVMHYLCGGGGTFDLSLSPSDREAHRRLYAPPKQAATAGGDLVVTFEGGTVVWNAVTVLDALRRDALLPVKRYTVKAGDTIESIYKQALNLPGDSPSLVRLADDLNEDHFEKRLLRPGETLLVPALTLSTFDKTLRLDAADPDEAVRIRELRKNWDPWISNVLSSPKKSSEVTLVLTSWELRIPATSEEEAAKAKQLTGAIHLANTRAGWERQEGDIDFYSLTEPRQLWSQTIAEPQRYSKGVEGDLGYLVDLQQRGTAPKCDTRCPDVVLIDTDVYAHPDLDGALAEGSVADDGPPLVEGDFQFFRHATFDEQHDHGTHLAGIISARQNGFGVVGVDPDARVYVVPRTHFKESKLAQKIYERGQLANMQIFVVASSWTYPDPADRDRDRDGLNDESQRFENRVAGAIRDSRMLWVVAAGQDRTNLTIQTARTPMNLGDLPNVVVVSACTSCYGDAPHLTDQANYSLQESLVHVAAEGGEIPSTVPHHGYGAALGTSQAAALTGGLASLMVRRAPDTLTTAADVKRRLILTSRPTLSEEDAPRLAGGIVDARVALLDPARNWLLPTNGDYVAPGALAWRSRTLPVTDADTGDEHDLNTQRILRLYRLGKSADGAARFAIYEEEWVRSGAQTRRILRRTGPVEIDDNLEIATIGSPKKALRIADVRDLLLARTGGEERK